MKPKLSKQLNITLSTQLNDLFVWDESDTALKKQHRRNEMRMNKKMFLEVIRAKERNEKTILRALKCSK